ncbi:MAG: hypothetical protein ACR2HY_06080 [Acidimicrobiales bacterium]
MFRRKNNDEEDVVDVGENVASSSEVETSAEAGPEIQAETPGSGSVTADDPVQEPVATPPPPPVPGDERLGTGFWIRSVQGAVSRAPQPSSADLEQQANDELQAAIMPGLLGLRDAVPDAASPDDAMRILAQREAEHDFPPDPEAGALVAGDIFGRETSVYYRIRRHFERPRRARRGEPWRPPPGLARPDPADGRALDRG